MVTTQHALAQNTAQHRTLHHSQPAHTGRGTSQFSIQRRSLTVSALLCCVQE